MPNMCIKTLKLPLHIILSLTSTWHYRDTVPGFCKLHEPNILQHSWKFLLSKMVSDLLAIDFSFVQWFWEYRHITNFMCWVFVLNLIFKISPAKYCSYFANRKLRFKIIQIARVMASIAFKYIWFQDLCQFLLFNTTNRFWLFREEEKKIKKNNHNLRKLDYLSLNAFSSSEDSWKL